MNAEELSNLLVSQKQTIPTCFSDSGVSVSKFYTKSRKKKTNNEL